MTNPTYTIQLTTENETVAIVDLVNAAYTKWIDVIGRKPAPMTADYPALIANHTVYSARDGMELVGALVMWRTDDALYIDNLAVAPTKQGRGIGNMLLNFAEGKAREMKLNRLTLVTNEKMEYNQAYYLKYGFVETRRETLLDGRRVVWMHKQL